MRLNDLVDHRQPEAGAAFKVRLEGLENLFSLLRSHSGSGIRETNLPVVSPAFDAYVESATIPHRADRIRQHGIPIAVAPIDWQIKPVPEELSFERGKDFPAVYEDEGRPQQSTDTSALEKVIDEILAANPKQLEQYRAGKKTMLGFFVGQVMKASKGQASPQLVNELLTKKLG